MKGAIIDLNFKHERPSRDAMLIAITEVVSKRATCPRAHVGCVIAREGRVLSMGYNGSPPGSPHCDDAGCEMDGDHCIRTTHAEANAIAFAARHGIAVEGAVLYVTGWSGGSCYTCKKLAKAAGITKIIHGHGQVETLDMRSD